MTDLEKWGVWHYRATIVNDAGTSGTHSYVASPGAGSVVILLGGQLLNGDTVSRNAQVTLRDTDNETLRRILPTVSVAAAARRDFPTTESTADGGASANGIIVSGTEDFLVSIISLAASENTELSLQGLVYGASPTVTITSPANAVETVTEDRIV